jgi:hypothetical protein
MALIDKPDIGKLENVKLRLSPALLTEVEQYCEWAGFKDDLAHFFTTSATFVLTKDKEWKQFKKSKKDD